MTENPQNWLRDNSFISNVVLLDGLTGTGKTLIMKTLDLVDNLMPAKFNYQLEQVLIGIKLGEINENFGVQVAQLILDQMQYDMSIGRELNLRPRDLSSIWASSKRARYLSNMLLPDGNEATKRIEKSRSSLLITTHQLIDSVIPLRKIPHKNLKHILCMRHPYYLLDHWVSYLPMHGKSASDFTLVNGEVPWFISHNSRMYLESTTFDRAMIAISELTNNSLRYLESDPINVTVIDFEKFVLDPISYINTLNENIGFIDTIIAQKSLKKQKVPREHINDSLRKRIYLRYGAGNLSTNLTHKEDYSKLQYRISSSAKSEVLDIFEESARLYEAKFGLWF